MVTGRAKASKVPTTCVYCASLRIPRGRRASSSSHLGPPVLLVHGISVSSTCWVVNQPDESLAFILADKGTAVPTRSPRPPLYHKAPGPEVDSVYFILHLCAGHDVWMMNTRGNTFSRGHIRHSDSDSQYWAFSIDEMALQDLPATIDYLLKVNSRHKKAGDKSAIVGLCSMGSHNAYVPHSTAGPLPCCMLALDMDQQASH